MSRFSKNDLSRARAAVISPLMSAWAPRSTMPRVLTTEELEHREATFARFTKNIVEFRQGKQSSCRGAWTSKEYSEVRVMLRQVPKEKALEMYAIASSHLTFPPICKSNVLIKVHRPAA